MQKRRRIIGAAGCALTLGVLAAPAASASPLLSGYGGPGQGNQAILGSTLLNGPGAGGGSSGGSAGAQQSASGNLAAAASEPASSSVPALSGQKPEHGAPASSSHQQRAAGGSARSALPPSFAYDRAERTGSSSGSGSSLGRSAADFVYAGLVLVGLVLAGVVTRRLTRTSPAKGHG